MSRKKRYQKKEPILNSSQVTNGLAEAIMPTTSPFQNQITEAETIIKNLRYYLVSNFRQVLSQAYVELGLIQSIVDVPVDDALRGGVQVTTSQISEEEIQDLMADIERDNLIGVAAQAGKWQRLFGGAGILLLTDQDPESELDLNAISKDSPIEFRAVDMWELFWDKQSTEGFDAELQEYDMETFSYYGKKIHKSRVLKMKGLEAPSFIRPRLRGWGVSVVEILVRSINQYLKATECGFEVLDEFKLDIFKIKNLANTLLSPNGTEMIQKRVALANQQKNFQNALTMDSEDDYLQKQLSFAGLSEAMTGFRMQIASDMRMPLTKIFGISSAGFNSGEDDIENYNAMIEGQVRAKLKFHILKMIGLKCQQKFGFVPDDLQIEFKALRILSAEQEENVKTQKFNRLMQARERGEITSLEFRLAVNRDKLLPIQLDTKEETLSGIKAAKPDKTGISDADKAQDGTMDESAISKPTSKKTILKKDEADA